MTAEPKKIDPQQDEKQTSVNNQELPEDDSQADLLQLDSDLEVEELVKSITSKDPSRKKE
jgi:hypothetical protein